jgi:hypothetical protein
MLTTNLRFLFVGIVFLIVGCQKDPLEPRESQSPLTVFRKPVNWNIHGIYIEQDKSDNFWFWGSSNLNDNSHALIGNKSAFELDDLSLGFDADVVLHDVKMRQSNIAFAGEIHFKGKDGSSSDALIGLCDDQGKLIWWDTIQGPYQDEFRSICFLNDSLIGTAGTMQSSPKASKSIIACFGMDGARKWSKLIDGFSLVEKGIQINKLNENEVLLTKSISSGSGGRYEYLALNSFLIEDGTEANINIEFVKQSSFKGWGTSFYREVDVWNAKTVIHENGDILVFGQRLQDQTFGDSKAYLFGVCTSGSGTLKWEKEYDFLYNQAYLNDVQIEDSCILSVAYLKDGRINNELLILDELGSPVQQISLDLSSPSYNGIPWKILSNERGYQIIGDMVDLRTGSKDIFSLEINKKGEVNQ